MYVYIYIGKIQFTRYIREKKVNMHITSLPGFQDRRKQKEGHSNKKYELVFLYNAYNLRVGYVWALDIWAPGLSGAILGAGLLPVLFLASFFCTYVVSVCSLLR